MEDKPKGLRLLGAALTSRKTAIMLVFGFAAGLPYTLLIGTLNAWLGEWEINLATIGILSWIGLAYAFKFLWSPLVDRTPLPLLMRLSSMAMPSSIPSQPRTLIVHSPANMAMRSSLSET